MEFRKAGIRIGSLDLRIATITLAHAGILLSRNLQDLTNHPSVRYERDSRLKAFVLERAHLSNGFKVAIVVNQQ